MAGIIKESLGEFFVGQGDMMFFDPILDYAAKTLADLKNGKSFGNIKEGSTSWTGEAITDTIVKNEQGNVIVTSPTAGTLAFEAVLTEMDNAMVKKLLAGADILLTGVTADWIKAVASTKAVGIGFDLPVVEMPVAITNDIKKKTLIFPRAKVASTLVYEDKMLAIKMSITAQAINTAGLKTGVILYGELAYAA